MVGKIINLDDGSQEAQATGESLREWRRQELEDEKWLNALLGPIGSEKYLSPAPTVPAPGPKIVPVIILVPMRGV